MNTEHKKETILVAEDDSQFAKPLVSFLKSRGYGVVWVKSWRGLSNAMEAQAPIALALVDLILSGQSASAEGIENIRTIHERRPLLPIIVITQHSETGLAEKAKLAGATEMLNKSPAYTAAFLESMLMPVLQNIQASHLATRMELAKSRLKALGEDALLAQVIVPLFRKMGYDAERVRHHGRIEEGMDIMPFYQVDPFGERIYYAAQIKAVDIHGNNRKKGNAAEVVNQASAALKATILDPDRCLRRIDRFFVITSGEITPDARIFFEKALGGERQISLVDGTKLIGLLSSYGLLDVQNRGALAGFGMTHKQPVFCFIECIR